ncbi:beta-1,4 N-acetylgalactosaminyltransferase 1-like [Branchiostoma lanceolatum]|uniref:beta-1,4 N-acetylgalactosaminyltransferase 1-like n=1 Tax=Branchiostoma lanceolatum TaxID=7740 RepID=UPI003454E9DA
MFTAEFMLQTVAVLLCSGNQVTQLEDSTCGCSAVMAVMNFSLPEMRVRSRTKVVAAGLLLLLTLGTIVFQGTKVGSRSRHDILYAPSSWQNTQKSQLNNDYPWKGGGLQHIPYVWKDTVARRVLPDGNCSCPDETPLISIPLYPYASSKYFGSDFASNPDELKEVMNQRNKEKERLEQRAPPLGPVLFANGKSPLSYPTQGLRVEPMGSIVIPGLKLEELAERTETFDIQLNAQLGVLTTLADIPSVIVEGGGTKHLSISSGSLDHLNRQLQFLAYTNTDFDPDTVDYADIRYIYFQGTIPIRIQHKRFLQIFDFPQDDIAARVTIVTKTFLRYNMLLQLIDSVRQFYPTITIIIADDSEHPEKVEGENIEHYIMPYKKGWFAGRNLAVSQVTTPYFLWVDDDFIFTQKTKIELLLQVAENTNLDVIGGVVRDDLGLARRFTHKIRIEDGDDLGDCLFKSKGYYHAVEGFPDCVLADVIINFFLADTMKVQNVRFDPRLARIGHTEFFMDGLGKLRVASCSHVAIDHASKIWPLWQDKKYKQFRDPVNAEVNKKSWFYKYNLKCIHSE